MVDQQDRLCGDSILLSLMKRKPPLFRAKLELDRLVTDQILRPAAIDIMKMLRTAAHHCAIKERSDFLVEAPQVSSPQFMRNELKGGRN
jgi:hypothetical protein